MREYISHPDGLIVFVRPDVDVLVIEGELGGAVLGEALATAEREGRSYIYCFIYDTLPEDYRRVGFRLFSSSAAGDLYRKVLG